MPSQKLCQKLAKRDAEICAIAEGGGVQKTDLSTVDPDKMRVKELKSLLNEHGLSCVGCTEKAAFVKLVKEKLLKTEL